MVESAGKRRKIYVDYPKGKSKTCLVHGTGHSSDECKVLGYFFSKYVKSRSTKDRGHDPISRNNFHRQQENNDITNSAVDEILLHENEKISAVKEAPKKVEYGFDENELYQIDNISLEDTKEKLE